MKYKSSSAQKTQQIASSLAKQFQKRGGVIALSGQLGSGKTTFVQGFAKGLGIKEKIISPTFVLIRQHKIPNSKRMLYHLDLYRLEDPQEIKNIGLEEIINNPENIVLIEWAEKLQENLPANSIFIKFNKVNNDQREIYVSLEK